MTTYEVIRQCREALEEVCKAAALCGFREDQGSLNKGCRSALRAIDEWEAEAEDSAMCAHSLANTAVDAATLAAAWQALAEERGEALREIRDCLAYEDETIWLRNDGERFSVGFSYPGEDETEWQASRLHAALATTPADALARRDERMKALGAAEWLEREANTQGDYYERSSDGMKEEAAALRQKAVD